MSMEMVDIYPSTVETPLVNGENDIEGSSQGNDLPETSVKGSKFNNPYVATNILITWLSVIVVFFAVIGLWDGDFFGFGPRPDLILFGVAIDTWWKWSSVMVFNFVDLIVYEYATETIRPYITNTVQDHKTTSLGYSKKKVMYIVSAYELCGYVRMVVNFHMIFTQVDFILAMYLGNLISETATTWEYIKNKK